MARAAPLTPPAAIRSGDEAHRLQAPPSLFQVSEERQGVVLDNPWPTTDEFSSDGNTPNSGRGCAGDAPHGRRLRGPDTPGGYSRSAARQRDFAMDSVGRSGLLRSPGAASAAETPLHIYNLDREADIAGRRPTEMPPALVGQSTLRWDAR